MAHPKERMVHLAVGLGPGVGLVTCAFFRLFRSFLAVEPQRPISI
jgi:hypothetical protein